MGSGGRGGELKGAAEGGAQDGAEGAEDGGEVFGEGPDDIGLVAVTVQGDGLQVDDEGAGGQVRRTGPGIRGGEEDGAADALLEGVRAAGADFLVNGHAHAGGDTAHGIGDVGAEGANVVKGEHPVTAGDPDEFADGSGRRSERSAGGIDQSAEDAGSDRFAGAGRALEDEDGIGSEGTEGGQQPGEAAEPIGAVGQVEAGAQGFERVAGGGEGRGHGRGARGRFEGHLVVGDDGPALRGDVHHVALGTGEVDEDGVGDEGLAAGADPEGDGDPPGAGFADGAGLELVEDGAEGLRIGGVAVLDLVLAEEPVAEGGGAEGDALIGELGEGAVFAGSEEGDAFSELHEYGGLARGFGHGIAPDSGVTRGQGRFGVSDGEVFCNVAEINFNLALMGFWGMGRF
jgi:hypothetical protein